ncbi:MAG: FkbM family methyltransferase, partial [Pseudomonadota bacterium]
NDQMRVVDEDCVRVEPLDKVVSVTGFAPDVLKADVQGGEACVLGGAEDSLDRSIFFVEAEVSFLERYCDQPSFADIEAHLRGRGFELIDLHRLKRYRHRNAAGLCNLSLGKGQRAGRIAYADAFFLLCEDVAAARCEAMDAPGRSAFVLKAVMVLLAYGKPDLAARWFDLYADCFEPPARRSVEAGLAMIGRRRFGLGHLYHVFEYIARRL